MARVDVDRMRRYAERGEVETAERERRRWLASLSPEHRARHESPGLLLCGECMNRGLAVFAERVAAIKVPKQSA